MEKRESRQIDVLMVHHHTTNPHRPILVPAMGVLSLTDMLNRHGVSAQAVHMGVEARRDSAFNLADHVREHRVKLVGLSVHWFFQLPDSLDLAAAIKEACPDVVTLLGGFSASWFAPEIMAQHEQIDGVIRGDAEVPLLEFTRRLGDRDRASWGEVPNLTFRAVGGEIIENPHDYVIDHDEFSRVVVTNVEHLKSKDDFFKMEYYPSRRFVERFDFKNDGVICLEVGRGCSFTCALCGGNRHAQWKINRRSKPIFQPVEAVLENIRQGMAFGYGNFYLCYDAPTGGDYFKRLFERIRGEGLDIRLMFECWGLPSVAFIEDFRRTFRDGIIALSPDSGVEEIRDINKGALTYSNEDLLHRLALIKEAGLVAHVFFGYFQPGDTEQTVMTTRRFAHDLEDESREVFYLAYSTDPGSIIQTQAGLYDMVVEVSSLAEYMELLNVNRASSNLLAHRPGAVSKERAARITIMLNADQLLHRLIPATMTLASVGGFIEEHHRFMETFLRSLPDSYAHGIRVSLLVQRFVAFAREQALPAVMLEMIDFETRPWVLKDQHFSPVGAHYTSVCREVTFDARRSEALLAAGDAVQETEAYHFDLQALKERIEAGTVPTLGGGVEPEEVDVTYSLVVDKDGAFSRSRPG